MRYWCEDETRVGLITKGGKKLTALGVQPAGVEQWCFDYLWLYGLVEARTGESFFAEFSHLDGMCFQEYLKWFSQKYPEELQMIQLDNGRFHKWSKLEVPENIILLFQPAYSPQVNPIERLWQEIKKELKWELFENLDSLRNKLSKILSALTEEEIASIAGWEFILEALTVANI